MTTRPCPSGNASLAVDEMISLTINGATQKLRTTAARHGLPPLLVVQAGPGFPLLHEVPKYQRLLRLEDDFLVFYWEQRGTGSSPNRDAKSVTLKQQTDDLQAVLRWVYERTGTKVMLFGVSIGGTLALRVAEREPKLVASVVALSTDAHGARSDAAADAVLRQHAARDRRLARKLDKLGKPPYTVSGPFQRRTTMLSDIGSIERGKTFSSLLKETMLGMLRTYGVLGTVSALRNMNTIQAALLGELATLDIFRDPPRLTMPVHYIFGENDALAPRSLGEETAAAIEAPARTIAFLPNAGHMVHFDQPDRVREIVKIASQSAGAVGHDATLAPSRD